MAAPEPGEPAKGKPFKLLGILDVENIPCARDSILYGSLGSVVAGLGHFLLTSEYLFFSMYDEHFLNGLICNVEFNYSGYAF